MSTRRRSPGDEPATMLSEDHRTGRRPPAGAARVGAWCGGLLLLARGLHGTGHSVRVPAGSWSELSAWLGTADPIGLAAGGLRLAAIAATWYLLAATALTLVADRAGWSGLARAVRRASPALVRRVVLHGSGLGLAVGALVGGAAPADADLPTTTAAEAATASPGEAPDASTGHATMTRLPTPLPDDGSGDGTAPGHATMTRLPAPLPDDGSGDDDRLEAGPDGAEGGESRGGEAEGGEADTEAVDSTWIVGPGDSFWSIAEEVLGERAAARPDDRRIAAYWHVLIEANRIGLTVPSDPDLLVPGQRLVVPAPPPA